MQGHDQGYKHVLTRNHRDASWREAGASRAPPLTTPRLLSVLLSLQQRFETYHCIGLHQY